ncbi:hypothetical protein VKT23_019252 [Stygiomarasmius scandens]|uniref:Uncharacterized protein n=1 Tax=Marasmiellus scandens TaxID=2682957 RepID=A0ABR1ILS7_9AGAR
MPSFSTTTTTHSSSSSSTTTAANPTNATNTHPLLRSLFLTLDICIPDSMRSEPRYREKDRDKGYGGVSTRDTVMDIDMDKKEEEAALQALRRELEFDNSGSGSSSSSGSGSGRGRSHGHGHGRSRSRSRANDRERDRHRDNDNVGRADRSLQHSKSFSSSCAPLSVPNKTKPKTQMQTQTHIQTSSVKFSRSHSMSTRPSANASASAHVGAGVDVTPSSSKTRSGKSRSKSSEPQRDPELGSAKGVGRGGGGIGRSMSVDQGSASRFGFGRGGGADRGRGRGRGVLRKVNRTGYVSVPSSVYGGQSSGVKEKEQEGLKSPWPCIFEEEDLEMVLIKDAPEDDKEKDKEGDNIGNKAGFGFGWLGFRAGKEKDKAVRQDLKTKEKEPEKITLTSGCSTSQRKLEENPDPIASAAIAKERERRKRAEAQRLKRELLERKHQALAMGVGVYVVHTLLGEEIPVAETSAELIHTLSCMVLPVLRTFNQTAPELVCYSLHLLSRVFPSPLPSLILPGDGKGKVEVTITKEHMNQVAVMMVRTWMMCLRLSFSWMHDRFYPLGDWAYWTHLPPTILQKSYIQLLHLLSHNLCISRTDWIVWLQGMQTHFRDFIKDVEWTRKNRVKRLPPTPTRTTGSKFLESPGMTDPDVLADARAIERLQDLEVMLVEMEDSTMQVFVSEAFLGAEFGCDSGLGSDEASSSSGDKGREASRVERERERAREKKLQVEMKERFMDYMRSDLPRTVVIESPAVPPRSASLGVLEGQGQVRGKDKPLPSILKQGTARVEIDLKRDDWPDRWPWATFGKIMEEKEKGSINGRIRPVPVVPMANVTGAGSKALAKAREREEAERKLFDLTVVTVSGAKVLKLGDVALESLRGMGIKVDVKGDTNAKEKDGEVSISSMLAYLDSSSSDSSGSIYASGTSSGSAGPASTSSSLSSSDEESDLPPTPENVHQPGPGSLIVADKKDKAIIPNTQNRRRSMSLDTGITVVVALGEIEKGVSAASVGDSGGRGLGLGRGLGKGLGLGLGKRGGTLKEKVKPLDLTTKVVRGKGHFGSLRIRS